MNTQVRDLVLLRMGAGIANDHAHLLGRLFFAPASRHSLYGAFQTAFNPLIGDVAAKLRTYREYPVSVVCFPSPCSQSQKCLFGLVRASPLLPFLSLLHLAMLSVVFCCLLSLVPDVISIGTPRAARFSFDV